MEETLSTYWKGLKIGILDIETTGLSPVRNKIMLGGLVLYETPERGTIHQYFAEELAEEPLLLETYLEVIKNVDVLISYNGRSFDLPFVESRAKKLGIPFVGWPYHLDLYLLIQRASDLKKQLPNLKQKTIEDYLGLRINRKDEITGGESVSLYQEYLISREASLRDKVLLHNQDDLRQLSRLLRVTEKCDLHQGLFHLGFPVTPDLSVTRILFRTHHIEVEGLQHKNPITYYSFGNMEQNTKIAFDGVRGTFQLTLPLFRKAQSLFIDLINLGLDSQIFENRQYYESGFLIVQELENIHYPIMNQLILQLVDKIRNEMEDR